jgi:outer membrane protein assembly factor BamD (BamD/ComL family)
VAIIHKKYFSQICLLTRCESKKIKNMKKKIKKQNRILLYSWLPTEIYHKNWAIAIKIFKKIGEFGSFFFHGKSFV